MRPSGEPPRGSRVPSREPTGPTDTWWCWPAGSATSARCRCGPGRGWRGAARRRDVDVREWDVDAELIERLRTDQPDAVVDRPARRRGRERRRAGHSRAARGPVRRDDGARPAGWPGTSRPRRPSSSAPGSPPRTGWRCRTRTFRELGAQALIDAMVDRLGLPLMVKPHHGGSALGARWSRSRPRPAGRDGGRLAYGDTVLVEQFVDGIEVAITVVRGRRRRARAARRSRSRRGRLFDYDRRYTPGADDLPLPGPADRRGRPRCWRPAPRRRTARSGLRDVSRTDAIVDADGACSSSRSTSRPADRDLDAAECGDGRHGPGDLLRAARRAGDRPRLSRRCSTWNMREQCFHVRTPESVCHVEPGPVFARGTPGHCLLFEHRSMSAERAGP